MSTHLTNADAASSTLKADLFLDFGLLRDSLEGMKQAISTEESYRATLAMMENDHGQKDVEIASLKGQVQSLEAKASETQEVLLQLRDLNSTLSSTQQAAAESSKRVEACIAEMSQLKRQLEDKKSETDTLKVQLALLHATNKELRESFTALKDQQQSAPAAPDVSSTLQRQLREGAARELAKLRDELTESAHRRHAELTESADKIHDGLRSEFRNRMRQVERQKEMAIKEKQEALDTMQPLKAKIQDLTNDLGAQLCDIEQLEIESDQYTIEVCNLQAVCQRKDVEKKKMSALEQERLNDMSSNLTEARSRIDAFEQQLEEISETNEDLQESIDLLTSERNESLRAISIQKGAYRDLEKEIKAKDSELARVQSLVDTVQQEKTQAATKAQNMSVKLNATIESLRDQIVSTAKEFGLQVNALADQLQLQQEKYHSLELQKEQMMEELTNKHSEELVDYTARLKNAEAMNSSLKSQAAEMQTELEALKRAQDVRDTRNSE